MTRAKGKRGAAVVLFVLAVWAAARFTGCDAALFWARRSHLTDILRQMIPPDWSYFGKILSPLWATVQMSVTGTVLGAALAAVFAPLCAKNLPVLSPVRGVIRLCVQILRSFPSLILALLATFLFGLGTFSGTLAITLYTAAILTRLTYEDIEGAPIGSFGALCAMGSGAPRAYVRAVFPEIAPSYFTNVLYLLETNVRHSAILGYVGAGGIGLVLSEKISWREYDKVAVILAGLFVTAYGIEAFSRFLSRLIREEQFLSAKSRRALVLAGCCLFVVCTLTLQGPDFSHTSPQIVRNLVSGFLHPDWAFFFGGGETGLAYLLLETVCIALVGTVFGTVLALPLAFLNTPRFLPRPIAWVFRLLIVAIRSVPFLIYGLILIRVSGPGAFTGVLTLAVCSVGLLTKRFTEAIESLDFRAYHALAAMGVSPLLRIRYAVLPQLLPALASAVLYRFDVNLREAAVLGLVGAGGIGAPLIFAMNQYNWRTAGAIALGLVLLVWLIDRLSGRLRAAV
jgi:phosphonate transport system permease protein